MIPNNFHWETGLLSLFLPSFNRLVVITSIFSKSLTTFPSATGKSLIAFEIYATIVSHCSTEIVDLKLSFPKILLHVRFTVQLSHCSYDHQLGTLQSLLSCLNAIFLLYLPRIFSCRHILRLTGYLHLLPYILGKLLKIRLELLLL